MNTQMASQKREVVPASAKCEKVFNASHQNFLRGHLKGGFSVDLSIEQVETGRSQSCPLLPLIIQIYAGGGGKPRTESLRCNQSSGRVCT